MPTLFASAFSLRPSSPTLCAPAMTLFASTLTLATLDVAAASLIDDAFLVSDDTQDPHRCRSRRQRSRCQRRRSNKKPHRCGLLFHA
jgi:hypothetical protein